jgi:hypothetical protein
MMIICYRQKKTTGREIHATFQQTTSNNKLIWEAILELYVKKMSCPQCYNAQTFLHNLFYAANYAWHLMFHRMRCNG